MSINDQQRITSSRNALEARTPKVKVALDVLREAQVPERLGNAHLILDSYWLYKTGK